MVVANKATGLNPVEDPSVPKDYTLSVPIFQKESSFSDNDYTAQARRTKGGIWRVYHTSSFKPIQIFKDHSDQTTKVFRPDHKIIQTNSNQLIRN